MAPFDTLKYAKRLEEAGVSREAAEAHAEALGDLLAGELVTRETLERELEKIAVLINKQTEEFKNSDNRLSTNFNESLLRLRIEFLESQARQDAAIAELRSELKSETALLKAAMERQTLVLTIRLGLMLAAVAGVVLGIARFAIR